MTNFPLFALCFSLLAFLGAGCHPFVQNFDSGAALCRIAPETLQPAEVLVLLQDPAGLPLSPELLMSSSSRLQLINGESQDLSTTPGGCLRVSRKQGLLQVFTRQGALSYSGMINPEKEKGSLIRIRLEPNPRIQTSLSCPESGLFSDQSLDFPLRWNSSGSLASAQFELSAENLSTRQRFELYRKAYGENPEGSPAVLRTDFLPEGVYDLRLRLLVAQGAWDQLHNIPEGQDRCRLTVLHGPAQLSGLDAYPLYQGVAIFNEGSVLPWKSSRQEGQLLFCKEARDQIESAPSLRSPQCQARNRCQDPSNFKSVSQILADQPGLFDYHSLVKLPTGQTSNSLCQTVLVTQTSPELQLSWDNPRWNEKLAVMDFPQPDIGLSIRRVLSQQPWLEDDHLDGKLQCKAEFVYSDQTIRPGRKFTCLNGLCKGQSLENYKDCSPDFRMSISSIWPTLPQDGGYLRVSVRYNAGNNQIEEQSLAIGIKPRKWKALELMRAANQDQSSLALLKNTEGQFFQLTDQALMQWQPEGKIWFNEAWVDGDWKTLPRIRKAGSWTKPAQIWLDRAGTLFSQQIFAGASGAADELALASWNGTSWVEWQWPSTAEKTGCQKPQAGRNQGFWCYDAGGNILIAYDNTWTQVSAPDSQKVKSCARDQSLQITETADGDFAMGCGTELWLHEKSQWTRLQLPEPELEIRSLGSDVRRQLWLLQAQEKKRALSRWIGTGWDKLPEPASWPANEFSTNSLLFHPKGAVYSGGFQWNEVDRAWSPAPVLNGIRPQSLKPFFTLNGDIAWQAGDSIFYQQNQKLIEWNGALLGLSFDALPVSALLVDAQGFWVLAHRKNNSIIYPYRLSTGPYLFIPPPVIVGQQAITNIWVNDLSRPQIYYPNVGLFRLDADTGLLTLEAQGWNEQLKSPGLNEMSAVETEIFMPYLVAPTGVFKHQGQDVWTAIAEFDENTYFFGGTLDVQGRIWVYNGETPEVGIIDGDSFRRVALDESQGQRVAGIFKMNDELWVASDLGLILMGADAKVQEFVSWKSLGVRDFDRIRKLDENAFMISTMDPETREPKDLSILERKDWRLQAWRLPPKAMSLSVGNVKRNSRGEIILEIGFDIFIGDGQNWRNLFTRAQLYGIPGVGGYIQYFGFELDAYDRLWINIRQGLIMIDTRPNPI